MTGRVCVKCQVEMRPEKNGVGALLMAADAPYHLYDADLWKCPVCGIQAVLGFGKEPVAEAHEPDFMARLATYDVVFRFWSSETDKEAGS